VTDERSTDSGIEDGELLDPSELDPALAMPSPRVYRGSLIALLLGSVFAVWLLVLPPVGADRDQPPASIEGIVSGPAPTTTATPEATSITTPTPTPTSTPTPTATAAPTAEATATAAPSETTTTYTVRSGDTMFAIAELYLPAGKELNQFADEIAAANGIADMTQIQVGQVLDIPGQ
jgi:LysM repeat protein